MAAAASCILPQRQLSFADSRQAGQNLPTEDWPQSPEPPPAHKVWHWTDWRVSLQHGTADSRPHTPDMPNVRSPRHHLVISHKLGEEILQLTEGSSGNGCIHPRDWVGHLNPGRTTTKKKTALHIKKKENAYKKHTWRAFETGSKQFQSLSLIGCFGLYAPHPPWREAGGFLMSPPCLKSQGSHFDPTFL